MTLDKSLKVSSTSIQNRNVLTRAERIAKLQEAESWKEGDKVLGLQKVRVIKVELKKKKKAKKEEGEGEGTAAPAAAPAKPAGKAGKAGGKGK